MRCYLSFSDKEVFEGVTPPDEVSTDPVEEAEPHSMKTVPAVTPKEQATREASQGPAMERKSPKLPRWEKVLHPSWPVVPTGQLPHPSKSPEQTHLLMADCNWHTKMAPIEAPSHVQELEAAQWWTPTPGFLEVTACLRGQLLEEVSEAPLGPFAMGMMTAPGVVTMSASHVIRDEVTGATYLDMVTTLVGRVTLSGPEREIPAQGPTIEDVMDLVWRVARYPPLGGRRIPIPLLSGQNKNRLPMGGQACQRPPLGGRSVMPRGVLTLNIPMLP